MQPAIKLAPVRLSIVDQYKYDIDAERHWLIRFIFHYLWCPLIEFGLEKFKLPLWDTKDEQGRYSYRGFQGVYSSSWKAEQEAAKYPHASCMTVTLDESQPARDVLIPAVHPHAVTNAYERINNKTVSFPVDQVARLREKLDETAP